MATERSIKDLLAENTHESAPELVQQLSNHTLRCVACGHRCVIKPGREGVCRVRFNDGGTLRVPWGYVAGLAIDPIEKKPFYHAYPGRDALSFGMLGCDFHCSYCQNWVTSQMLRDSTAMAHPSFVTAQELVDLAVRHETPVMVSTYNEPLITADWAVEIFRLAREQGIKCGFVSNGNATPEVLEYIRPYVDLYKIDLKSFDDKRYRQLGGVMEHVLDCIRMTKRMGFWVEVVTLIVPDFNDSDDELKAMADFIVSVSPEIPWHVTAFHPDYKMTDKVRTPVESLGKAYEFGMQAGLKFVYAGNAAGAVGDREDTRCPSCGETMIRRIGFNVRENRMRGSCCSACGAVLPGVWEEKAAAPPRGYRWPMSLRMC